MKFLNFIKGYKDSVNFNEIGNRCFKSKKMMYVGFYRSRNLNIAIRFSHFVLYLHKKKLKMIFPDYIKKGDLIRIVAPAGKIKKEFVASGVEWLRNEGYEVIVGDHVQDELNNFAGTDEDRLFDLQQALDDPDASAVICARGGYGTIRVIDRIDFSRFLKYPKWVVGFSDITILHNLLNGLEVASVHGPMLRHFPGTGISPSESVQKLFSVLKGGKLTYVVQHNSFNRSEKTEAELIGGNLSIIYSLLGTPNDLDFTGKILFIEDIGEYLYHIDRMIHSLKYSGAFDKIAGLVVGDFTDMKDSRSDFGMDVYEIITTAVGGYNFPVCFDFPAGHDKKNLPLVFGQTWQLKVSELETVLKML